jgi:3,2-trans-enoyl-CoA isomerase
VLTRALNWLEELLKLPSAAMLATRQIARADMIDALQAFNDDDLDGFIEDWYAPGTQAALQALVARLKK